MPKTAKDKEKIEKEKVVKQEVVSKKEKVSKTTPKKTNTRKETTSKKTPKKESTVSNSSRVKKSSTTKKVSKTTNKAKKTTTKTTGVTKSTSKKKIEIMEYYDLPNSYNSTVVKVLAQTPNTLFVYWDISDEDKNKYITEYGEYFFNNTKPVLKIINKTMNYSYEIDVNDYANSWYLRVNDSDCKYRIELGRRPINHYVEIPNNYLHISSSNNMQSPNDHILFDFSNNNVYFKNVRTNIVHKKDLGSLSFFKKIGKMHSVSNFYKSLYPEENIIDLSKPHIGNPSSNSSTFK